MTDYIIVIDECLSDKSSHPVLDSLGKELIFYPNCVGFN